MAKNEGNAFLGAEVSNPVPGEHAFYSDHDVLPEGSDDAKRGLGVCFDVLMNPDLASGIKDADKHSFGMKVDSTIILVLFGVEFHMASSLLVRFGSSQADSTMFGGGLE
jgi:hypothetical protein